MNDFSVNFSLSKVPEIQYFVAREIELMEMRESLSSDGSRCLTVLHGLGGIGKTQLAIAYAKRYKDDYSAIFWLNVKDETSFQRSFTNVARQILQQHPDAKRLSVLDLQKNFEEVFDAVKAWLSLPGNTRWLLIYDNLDDMVLGNTKNADIDINRLFPDAYQGSIIVTARMPPVDFGHLIRVKKLESLSDSLQILEATSGRRTLIADADAISLAVELDGLPLALATAGAYLRRVPVDIADYLRLYKESWSMLHTSTPKLGSYKDSTLCSTWQLSYAQIQHQDSLAAYLLQWWAYFDNEDIWFELLQPSAINGTDGADSTAASTWMHRVVDELSFNQAMGTLYDYGFVEPHIYTQDLVGSRGYSMHACVHSWTVNVLNEHRDASLLQAAVDCVAARVPERSEQQYWLLQRRLLPHAMRCSSMLLDEDHCQGISFGNLGSLYRDQGKLAEAEVMFMRAFRESERTFGSGHTSTLEAITDLGLIYKGLGKYSESENMYLRAVHEYENSLGPDDMLTLKAVNHLALLYRDQDKLTKAEDLFLRVLEGREKALGPDNIYTLETVNCLGLVYSDQDKMPEAQEMYLRALQGAEKRLGPDHVLVFMTADNLAILYRKQGKLAEAEEMSLKSLRGKEKTLGRDHTSTMISAHTQAEIYRDQGKLDEAEEIALRALRIQETTLGPDHTLTLDVVATVGTIYRGQGRLDEAEVVHLRALRGMEKAVGPNHRETLRSVNNLGLVYRTQGKLAEAEDMYLRALRGMESAPYITLKLEILDNLGFLYRDQGKQVDAERMFMRALEGKMKTRGENNHQTLQTVTHLGLLYTDQGKSDEAEQMYVRALQGYENTLGPDHEKTLEAVKNLGDFYESQGRLNEARLLLQRAHPGALRPSDKEVEPIHKPPSGVNNKLPGELLQVNIALLPEILIHWEPIVPQKASRRWGVLKKALCIFKWKQSSSKTTI